MLIFKRYMAFVVFSYDLFQRQLPLQGKWHGCAYGTGMQQNLSHCLCIMKNWLVFYDLPVRDRNCTMTFKDYVFIVVLIRVYYTSNLLNKICLPENPVSQMHLKGAGNTWTHVPFSQILSQFSFPTTSEQFTPKTNGNSVDYYTETQRLKKRYAWVMKFKCMHKAIAYAILFEFLI